MKSSKISGFQGISYKIPIFSRAVVDNIALELEIFFGKSRDIPQDLRISSVLIGWYSCHMT